MEKKTKNGEEYKVFNSKLKKKYKNRKGNDRICLKEMAKIFSQIIENDGLYSYEIENLYGKVLASELSNDLGFSISFENGYFRSDYCKDLQLCQNHYYSAVMSLSYNEIKTEIKKQVGKNIKEVQDRSAFHYICSHVYMNADEKGEFLHTNASMVWSGFDMQFTFDILNYALNGERFRMLTTTEKKYFTENGYSVFNDNKYHQFEDTEIKIKRFNNGKVSIKGLTTEQWDKIEYILSVCGQVYNRR